MEKISAEERLSLIKHLSEILEKAKNDLGKFKRIDKELHELLNKQISGTTALQTYAKLIIPNQETIELGEKQIELLGNRAVENMDVEECGKYINS